MTEREDQAEPARVRLFVGGLAPGVSAHDLQETLARLGIIHDVEVLPCKQGMEQRSHRGFAYVDYEGTPASLAKLMSVYNGCKWRGEKLRIEKAKEHYLAKLRREWEADSNPEEGRATPNETAGEKVSEEMPGSNLASASRELKTSVPLPGLRILFPNTTKAKVLPFKGTGKHKYSFRREESLPLHLIYSAIDDEQGLALANGKAEASKSGRAHSSAVGSLGPLRGFVDDQIIMQQPRKRDGGARTSQPPEHALSGQELEDSLRQERERQLDLLSKLFPEEVEEEVAKEIEDIGNESRDTEMLELPTFNYAAGAGEADALPVESAGKSKKPGIGEPMDIKKASSVSSPWDRLFEAAAGVGIAEDISDSETGDLMDSDGPEGGTPANDGEPLRIPDTDQAWNKKKVNWKDLQEGEAPGGGKKRRRDHVLQEPDHSEATVKVATSTVEKSKSSGDSSRGAKKRNENSTRFELALEDPAKQTKTSVEVPPGKLEGEDFVAKQSTAAFYANNMVQEAVPEELTIERVSGLSSDSRMEKWKRMFEAAEVVHVPGLEETTSRLKYDEAVVAEVPEQNQGEPSVSQTAPVIQEEESQEQKWKRIFEAAGGGFEVPATGSSIQSPEKETDGHIGAPEFLGNLSVVTVPNRTPKAKCARSKTADKDCNGVTSTGSGAEQYPNISEPEMHLLLPQIDSENLEGSAGKSWHSAGPEVDTDQSRSQPDLVDSERDRATGAASCCEAHGAPPPNELHTTAATPEVDVTAKWMQKASWKSLVGENGVVGFLLGRTVALDLPLQKPWAATDEMVTPSLAIKQLPVTADKTGQKQPSKPVHSSRAVHKAGTSAMRTDVELGMDAGKGEASGLTSVVNPGPDSGEECTFMRSETAYLDWVTSKSKLKVDCKAKHKAAKRQIRRMRPPRKILLS